VEYQAEGAEYTINVIGEVIAKKNAITEAMAFNIFVLLKD
jgi:hypothetical protein